MVEWMGRNFNFFSGFPEKSLLCLILRYMYSVCGSLFVDCIIKYPIFHCYLTPFLLQAVEASLSQCSKTVMTPLKNRGPTRTIAGYFFNENLRPKLQLDVIGCQALLQNLLKTLLFRDFYCYLQNQMKNFTLSRLFFTFIWPLNVIKTLFTYFNHQIKSKT